jgi:hypothetical protein
MSTLFGSGCKMDKGGQWKRARFEKDINVDPFELVAVPTISMFLRSSVPDRDVPVSVREEGQLFPSKSVWRRMMRSLPRSMVIDRSY